MIMHEIAKVTLENEMDLVLAHKRSMKLAEIAGLSLPAQTTFATAVSEVARNTIDNGKNGCLTLGFSEDRKRSIVAFIQDDNLGNKQNREGLEYAKRLVDKLNVVTEEGESSIELYYHVPQNGRIDIQKLDEWRGIFRNEPPVSAYDEIKRKNEQLQQLSQKIKESEDHYRVLTDTLPIMLFSLNVEGNLNYVNKGILDFFGSTLEELNSISRHRLVHPDDLPAEETIRVLVLKKQPIKAEWRFKNKEGAYVWHLVSIIPLLNDGEPTSWFGSLVDIHAQKLFEETLQDNRELKKVQEQLQYHIQELNRSNEELQQFAYVASHDLQEPLRKIIYYSDYIFNRNKETIDDKSVSYLKNMVEAASRMRVLISDLLSFSQVDKKSLDIQAVNLNEIINEAMGDFEMVIKEKGARIELQNLPPVEGDKVMLRRLVDNLLSNALKYSREGVAPVVTISGFEKNGQAEIIIADNGIGFEEKFLAKMFTLFQRLHSREKFAGTGLGLAICRKIVEMHKGNITAKSALDSGSSFYIYLPIKQSQ